MTQLPIENFDISQTLPAINCDYDGLKNWALAYVARYKDLVITEDQVKEIKKDMAEINKAKNGLERARIDAVKAVTAPIREFEARIKEVVGIFDDAYKALGNQVKGFEDAAREAKRAEIQATIDRQIADFIGKHPDMNGKITILVPDKWLNKTCHMKDIGNEIDRLIREQLADEQERQRIEKTLAERRLFIENAVNAANEKYGISIPISDYMREPYISPSVNAADVLESINEEAEIRAKLKDGTIQPRTDLLIPSSNLVEIKPINRAADAAQGSDNPLRIFTFTAIYSPELEDQVKKILNQNHFMRIKRQLDSIGVKTSVERGNA